MYLRLSSCIEITSVSESWCAVPFCVTLFYAVAKPGYNSWGCCAVSSDIHLLYFMPPASFSQSEADVKLEVLQYHGHSTA